MRIADILGHKGEIARLDREVLLSHVLRRNRTWILAHGEEEVGDAERALYEDLFMRRMRGEPVAYLTGTRDFYGRPFHVEPGVLVPRPCTEALVETALALLRGEHPALLREIDSGIAMTTALFGALTDVRTIVDVGTGSGCIAVTMACERPDIRCIAIDRSEKALTVAHANAVACAVADRVECRLGSGLLPVDDLREPFLVITNPPYVRDASFLATGVRLYEPADALIGGGDDGGDILRMIVAQARLHPFCRGIVAECLVQQVAILNPPDLRPT